MDTRHYTSESEFSGASVTFLNEARSTTLCHKKIVTRITQTRQGCDLITQRHLNRRTDSRTWIRPRDGVAGTRAYIKRLQLDQRRQNP